MSSRRWPGAGRAGRTVMPLVTIASISRTEASRGAPPVSPVP